MEDTPRYMPNKITEDAVADVLASDHFVIVTYAANREAAYHYYSSSQLIAARLINVASVFNQATILPPQIGDEPA